ncbi:MAG: hypothetical protein DWQ07_01395 [Chloroflexi bacterium]|nr:MAG: hypothetical protein DWQ07_01395 [Chloroflexota bacterium]MBL1193848.1 hypothetical protein [Chloroflexota bacterium]
MRNRYIRAGYISFFVSPGLLIWPIWGATLVFTTIFSQFVGEAGSVDVYVPGLLNAPKVCGIVFGIVIGTVFGGAYGWIAFRNMRKAIAAFFVGGVGFGLAGFFGGGIFPLFGCINFESVDWYLVWKTPLHAALFGSIGGVAFGLFSSISETFNNIESKNLRA